MDYRALIDALSEVVREPTSNLTAAALLLAVFALVVLIGIVALLLFALGGPKTSRERAASRRRLLRREPAGKTADAGAEAEATPEPAAGRQRRSGRLLGWLAVLFVVAAAASANYITGMRSYCAETCHHTERVAESLGQPPHGTVSCVRCHEDPSGFGAAGYMPLRLGHALNAAGWSGATYPVPTPGAACQDCHGEALSATLVSEDRGVRMSHAEVTAAGMACDECHPGVGHGQASPVPMSRCLPCHDGERTSAECTVCHTAIPGSAPSAATADRMFGGVDLQPVKNCGGCHDQRVCDACHGLRLPHSVEFIEGDHARAAAFGRKTLCWRCHVRDTDCGNCHGDFTVHGPEFVRKHAEFPRDASCGVCHKRHEGAFCDRCH